MIKVDLVLRERRISESDEASVCWGEHCVIEDDLAGGKRRTSEVDLDSGERRTVETEVIAGERRTFEDDVIAGEGRTCKADAIEDGTCRAPRLLRVAAHHRGSAVGRVAAQLEHRRPDHAGAEPGGAGEETPPDDHLAGEGPLAAYLIGRNFRAQSLFGRSGN